MVIEHHVRTGERTVGAVTEFHTESLLFLLRMTTKSAAPAQSGLPAEENSRTMLLADPSVLELLEVYQSLALSVSSALVPH